VTNTLTVAPTLRLLTEKFFLQCAGGLPGDRENVDDCVQVREGSEIPAKAKVGEVGG
jgi:hypothetical protein